MLNMKKIDKVLDILEGTETLFAALTIIFIILINVIEIICRYFFSGSLGWPQELSTYLIIWVTYFGLSVLIKRGELIRVDMFFNKFPKTIKKVITLGQDITILIVTIFLIKYSLELKKIQETRNLITLNIPRAFGIYGAIIALFSIAFIVSIKIYKEFSKNNLSDSKGRISQE